MIVSQIHDHLGYIFLVIRPTKYQDLSLALGIPLINVKQSLRHTLDVRDVLSSPACAGSKEAVSGGIWEEKAAGGGSSGLWLKPVESLHWGKERERPHWPPLGDPLTEDRFHQPRLEANCLRTLQILQVEPVGPLGEVTEHGEQRPFSLLQLHERRKPSGSGHAAAGLAGSS